MAELLSDILKRLQGRDPIEEDKLARSASDAQTDYQDYTGDDSPDEEGIEEDSYTPGGILDPEAKVVGALGSLGKIGKLARMAEKVPPVRGVWQKAIRDPKALTEAVENPVAANAAYGAEQKAIAKAAQRNKDLRDGSTYRKSTAKPAESPLDYKSIKSPENIDARSEGDVALKWWEKPVRDTSKDTTLDYSQFKESGPGESGYTLKYPRKGRK